MDLYDFKKLKDLDGFNMCILGGSNSGKTFLTKHILNELVGNFNSVFLFLGSPHGIDNNYDNYIWPNHLFHFDNNDNDKKSKLKLKISQLIEWNNEISETYKSNLNEKPKILCIFDDIGSDLKNIFNNITNISRHAKISFIFLIHKYKHLDYTTRTSLTHCVFTNKSEYQDLLEENIRDKNRLKKFLLCINDITEKYNNKYKTKDDQKINKLYFILESDDFSKLYYYKLDKYNSKEVINSKFVWTTGSKMRTEIINSLKNIANSIED